MEDDWDLQAVVRGCTAANPSTPLSDSNQKPCFSQFPYDQPMHVRSVVDPFEARNAVEELHELYKPFFLSPVLADSHQTSTFCSFPSHGPPQSMAPSVTRASSTPATSRASGTKRRKNQQKRVCQVPAEELNSDVWAWRKYGQKPIKGSPYPRGYYKCSSSKGCFARKQVERNKSDPSMFIITYSAEHNHPAPTHRNSLAGSTRQKPLTIAAGDTNNQTATTSTCSSSSSAAVSAEEDLMLVSPKVENIDNLVAEDELSFSNPTLSDDFFDGLEDFACTDSIGGFFSSF